MLKGDFFIISTFFIGIIFVQTKNIILKNTAPSFQCNTDNVLTPEVKSYTVNLDDEYHLRWREVISDYKPLLNELSLHIQNLLGKTIFSLFKMVTDLIAKSLPEEYMSEMKGISEVSGISLSDVILFNIFNEFFSVCTSIVAIDENNMIYHARNLDFGLFMGWNLSTSEWIVPEILRKMTVKVIWVRNGIKVAESIGFPGYIGMITGMRPNSISITLNERFSIDGGYIGLIYYLLGRTTSKFAGFFIREEILSASDYETIISKLTSTEMIAPAYFIVGSSYRNASVITRTRTETLDVWSLNPDDDTWFALQTNYDHWNNPPFYDDRITPGNSCMKQMDRKNLSTSGLYNVLRTIPVRNMLTVYTAIMIPSEGYLKAYIQECPPPCSPW